MDPLAIATQARAAGGPSVASGLAESYGCVLEQQPSHLVPTRLLRELCSLPLPANASLQHQTAWLEGTATHSEDRFIPSVIHRDPWTLWVRTPGVGTVWPYLLGDRSIRAVIGLISGELRLSEIQPRIRKLLASVGALATPDEIEERRSEWDRAIDDAAGCFEDGYAAVGGLLHPFHLAGLRTRFRRIIRKGGMSLGDSQSPSRYVAHNEPVARFFHHELAPVVSRIARRRVKPSYVYLASYQSGAELPSHVDRAQCEYTLAMCVDFTPEVARETPWPLHLDFPDRRVTVYQALGDALLYKGRETPHHRAPLAQGRTSTSLFFHYVDQDFERSLD